MTESTQGLLKIIRLAIEMLCDPIIRTDQKSVKNIMELIDKSLSELKRLNPEMFKND